MPVQQATRAAHDNEWQNVFTGHRARLRIRVLFRSFDRNRINPKSLMREAVERKVAEQAEFVEWWTKQVNPRGRPKKNNADHALILSREQAERQTGIGQHQVSRWRARIMAKITATVAPGTTNAAMGRPGYQAF